MPDGVERFIPVQGGQQARRRPQPGVDGGQCADVNVPAALLPAIVARHLPQRGQIARRHPDGALPGQRQRRRARALDVIGQRPQPCPYPVKLEFGPVVRPLFAIGPVARVQRIRRHQRLAPGGALDAALHAVGPVVDHPGAPVVKRPRALDLRRHATRVENIPVLAVERERVGDIRAVAEPGILVVGHRGAGQIGAAGMLVLQNHREAALVDPSAAFSVVQGEYSSTIIDHVSRRGSRKAIYAPPSSCPAAKSRARASRLSPSGEAHHRLDTGRSV